MAAPWIRTPPACSLEFNTGYQHAGGVRTQVGPRPYDLTPLHFVRCILAVLLERTQPTRHARLTLPRHTHRRCPLDNADRDWSLVVISSGVPAGIRIRMGWSFLF